MKDTYTESNKSTLRWTAMGVIATILAGFAVSQPPRGSQVWICVVGICWIEILVGGAIVWRGTSRLPVKPATFVILLYLLGTYGAVLLASVVTYCVFFSSSAKSDSVIAAITLLESIAFLIASSQLANHDRAAQMETVNHEMINHARVGQGDAVACAIGQLKSLPVQEGELQWRREVIVKRLYGIEVALMHSHTSGRKSSPDADIQGLTDALAAQVATMRSIAGPESWQEVERLAGSLETTLRLHRIS